MKEATKEAIKIAKDKYPDWQLAKSGRPDMPSARSSVWKYDTWLPRAIANVEGYPEDHPWWTVTSEYANADSAATLALFRCQVDLLKRRGLWNIYLERLKLLPVISVMEDHGVSLNEERLDQLTDDYREESERLGRVCCNIAESYNYYLELPKSGNNRSLLEFMMGPLDLESNKVSHKTGAPSFDKTVLEHLEVTLSPKSKQLLFVRSLGAKRKRDTALSYMEGYKRYWQQLSGHAGWYILHPSLNSTGSDTLRFSSSNPNEQNISKKEGFNLRYCFGPAPGREWWSLDAENIELRIPAYESGERTLIELFENPDEPPYYGSVHLLNFSTVYPELWEPELNRVGIEKVGPSCKDKYASSWYQWCKNGDFAVQYGAVEGDEERIGTADRAFHKVGAHAMLKSRFSKLDRLNRKWIWYANEHGYVETMPDQTVDPEHGYPLLCTRNDYGKIKPTVPFNYHVQGTAMWWMMKAMIRCHAQLKKWPGCFMIMQVHDELVFDFPYAPNLGNLARVRVLKKLMEQGGDDIGLPTPVAITYNPDTWSEGVRVK
jgi:DNA polymerase I-like protein with 3'-5' exonuclease and polymerase domains